MQDKLGEMLNIFRKQPQVLDQELNEEKHITARQLAHKVIVHNIMVDLNQGLADESEVTPRVLGWTRTEQNEILMNRLVKEYLVKSAMSR